MTDTWNPSHPDHHEDEAWPDTPDEHTPDEHIADEHTPDPGEEGDKPGERSAVDDAIDAKLNPDEIGRMVDAATGDLIAKTLEKAARSAVARFLTADQIERIYTAAESVVADRFPHPDADEPTGPQGANPVTGEMPAGQVTDREYTRRFLNWCDEFLPIPESTLGQNQPYNWCKTWWEHPEAVARLVALWQAWEAASNSKDHRSMSSWWTDHWDRHIQTLLSGRGPFSTCSVKHDPHPAIPYARAPREFIVPAPPVPPAD